MTTWAIVPAAGIGLRMGSSIPKQYLLINGTPVLAIALEKLLRITALAKIVVALHPEDTYWAPVFDAHLTDNGERLATVTGGEHRQQSVLNGLLSLDSVAAEDDWVLVHDAVRPCVLTSDVEAMLTQLSDHPVGGLLGCAADNTLKQVNAAAEVACTVDRSTIWNAFTPQMFRYGLLRKALESAIAGKLPVTDEASALEAQGYNPQIVAGAKTNIKITHESDLALAARILELQGENK